MFDRLAKRLFGRNVSADTGPDESEPQADADADNLIARGNVLEDRGDVDGALKLYREAASAAPRHSRAHMNVGNALTRLERPDEALASYEAAVRFSPKSAPARFNLGAHHFRQGNAIEAEAALSQALECQPDMPEAKVLLADVQESLGKFPEAESTLRCALRAQPDVAGIALNLGQLLLRQHRFEDAEAWLVRAKLLGANFGAHDLSETLFRLNLRSDVSTDANFNAHAKVGEIIARWTGPPFTTWGNAPNPTRPLRIGYVSGDFREHPIGLFMSPVMAHHDRARFTVYGYSNFPGTDELKQGLMSSADHWREISQLSDYQAAAAIRDDQIDILVDLSGHTHLTRLSMFALHPAPVQVTWMGYLNTTGVKSMDFRICDHHTDPVGETERLHTEQLVRMPHSQWCYAPWYDIPLVPRPHPDRPDAVIFGSFNNYEKISDACLDLWCRVLTAVPGSELRVHGIPEQKAQRAMLLRFERWGLDPSRVEIRGRAHILPYFASIGDVDIALDTFPYNGATTTFDTLWMGVPLVALRGDRGIARGTYSILRSLGMRDLISSTPAEYVAANVALAGNLQWRCDIRNSLRSRLAKSPVMDSRAFVADLESLYHVMWGAWCDRSGSNAGVPR